MIRITFTPNDDARGGVDAEAPNFVDCVVEFISCFQTVYGPFDAVDALVPLFKTLAAAAELFGEEDVHSSADWLEMGEAEDGFKIDIERFQTQAEVDDGR